MGLKKQLGALAKYAEPSPLLTPTRGDYTTAVERTVYITNKLSSALPYFAWANGQNEYE